MDRLTEILDILADTEQVAALTDEQVGELHDELSELFATLDAEAAEGVSTELLADLDRCAGGIEALRTVAAERYATAEAEAIAAAEAEAEAAAALEAIRARVAAEAAAEGEGEAADPADEIEAAEVETPAEEPELVTADAGPASAPVRIPATPRRAAVPEQRYAPERPATQGTRWRRAGSGEHFAGITDIDRALGERHFDLLGTDATGKFRVASLAAEFPEQHRVTNPDVVEMAMEVRNAAQAGTEALEALTADGGICGPATPYYDEANVGTTVEPLRDSVTWINSDRGSIVWNNPLTLADIVVDNASGAIGSMTEAQDAAGATNKTAQALTCGSTTEIAVDISWLQLQFGVLQSRFNPERVANFTALSRQRYARYDEARLWTKMLALGTDVNAPQVYGALRDLITGVNRDAVNYRSRHRMPMDAVVEIRLPHWVAALVSDDQMNALQSYPEQFEVGRAEVERLFSLRNIRVAAWTMEEFTTAASDEGGVNAYPSAFKVVLSHPGAFVGVDGGMLDLGIYRDSTLVNDNNFRTFMERFWNIGMWGLGADVIEFSLCANGASAGSVEPTCGS